MSASGRGLRAAAAILAVAVCWTVAAAWIVPPLIVRAYRQESVPLLNDLIAGRHELPLTHYLTTWTRMARNVAIAFAALAVALAVASVPAVQAAVDARLGRGRTGPAPAPPVGRRRLLVDALILVVLTGSALAILTNGELWPFSPYHMYANTRRERTLTMLRLYGVTATGEVPLHRPEHVSPFDQSGVHVAFDRLLLSRPPPAVLETVVGDYLARYEARRSAGAHDGPLLVAMKLYRVSWTLDPWASNVDEPDGRELLATSPAGGDV